jgi:hypothetical protein
MEKHVAWADAREMELEKSVLAEYSEGEVRKHFDFFSSMIRRAGTEEELKSALYIKEQLDRFAVDSEILRFDAYISLPGEASLEVLSPVQVSIPCLPRIFITPTAPEGMEGELIFLGKGLEEDYRGVDLSGKIVLLQPGGTEGRMEAAAIAQEKGVAAQIHITSGRERAINFGQFRTTWGTPTLETFENVPKTAAVSICDEDGKLLIDLVRRGPVKTRLKANVFRGYKELRLPVAAVAGAAEPEKFVLLGGHYCSWFIGATDNAVANALMLEMARILSKHRKQLSRSVRFAWWPGHEQGTYAGSTWYLDRFWDDLRDNAIAYLVMDGLGRAGSSGFESRNTEEISHFQEQVIKDVLGLDARSRRVPKFGDQSFWGLGLPSMTGSTAFSAGASTAMGGNAVWYSHTAHDTVDKVDLGLAKIPFQVFTSSLLRLCNSPVLPFEFSTVAEVIKKGLNEIRGKTSLFDIESLARSAENLQRGALALNDAIAGKDAALSLNAPGRNDDGTVATINGCLMELSRILQPVLSSSAGKYAQDPMGIKFRPLPRLQGLVERLMRLNPGSDEHRACLASLIRERNRVSDALNGANVLLTRTLARRS